MSESKDAPAPGWYGTTKGERRYWDGIDWLDIPEPVAGKKLGPKAVSVISALTALAFLAGGLSFYYFSRGSSPDVPSAVTADEVVDPTQTSDVDDSAALSGLSGAIGGLYGFIETQSQEDCDYVGHTANQTMAAATPLDEYRGTYERITRNMRIVWELCSVNLGDPDAIALAKLTRPDAVTILNDRNYLGSASWK